MPCNAGFPTFFEVIVDSISVGSIVYQETCPFPKVNVIYPLDSQDIFGGTKYPCTSDS